MKSKAYKKRKRTKEQFEVVKKITFRWWRNGEHDVADEHREQLQEDAGERIREMTEQGYTSGALSSTIMDQNDEEIEYKGWWDVSLID